MKKERIFYLDFVRAIAVILILMTHYNAVYLYVGQPDKVFITAQIGNIYIGNFGVSLFFIISGAALMYVYDEKCELINFYKKRFLSIYPMFWIAYFIAFLYQFYVNKGIDLTVPKRNILLTILGFDGYFAAGMPTFYIFGLHHFDLYRVSFASVFDTDTSGAACGRGNGSVCDIFIDSTAAESG